MVSSDHSLAQKGVGWEEDVPPPLLCKVWKVLEISILTPLSGVDPGFIEGGAQPKRAKFVTTPTKI